MFKEHRRGKKRFAGTDEPLDLLAYRKERVD